MFRAQSHRKRREDTELNLQYPSHFFISGRGQQHRCMICITRPIFSSHSDALAHEGSIEHINSRREFDRPVPPPVSVTRSSGVAPAFIPSLGTTQAYSPYPMDLPTGLNPVPQELGATSLTQQALPPPPGPMSLDPSASWHSELHAWSASPDAYFAIPGPSLPSDPPDTIYGLCEGAADQDDEPLSDDSEEEMDTAEAINIYAPTPSSTYPVLPPRLPPEPQDFSAGPAIRPAATVSRAVPPPKISLPDMDPEVWWPFSSRQECLVCLMTAFPRAIFSGKELDVVRWFSKKCSVPGMPANSTIQSRFEDIIKLLGLESRLVQSKLNNFFALNSLSAIIANEMANPLVRSHMVFYPQDDGKSVKQAANGKRWTEEINSTLAAPMVRKNLAVGHHDYFVHEPFLASLSVGGSLVPQPLLPIRYFERSGRILARSHPLIPSDDGYIIDGETHLETPVSAFLLPFPEFCSEHGRYGMPSPMNIHGTQFANELQPWSEPIENPWRSRANGKIVCSVPLWLYCDDTSGNVSKKWNKHNSFLFTLAGVPREHSQYPYNVHFLATSNIATPLEMLEAISEDLCEARSNGILAYDCEVGEDVLVLPWVYAMQGDNPMQSELCSHIGMTGKFFCRVCQVRGRDKDRGGNQENEIDRIREFMQIHEPRHASQTVTHLQAQESIALRGTFSVVDDESRKTGVKDKYLTAFLSILKEKYDAQRKLGASTANAEFLQKLRQNLPDRLYNPALFIPDLDANQDTPVEILHVILLGIVKYFWRDAVSRQTQEVREMLKARINSLDLSGLGCGTPQGTTLVQYAGSLTGSDFRVVLQIGPLILYDLLPPHAYDAWLALSYLGPLAFQPEIEDIDTYIPRLSESIDALLQATVTWSPRWFNKPKFHVLLHLPQHIYRFGPAVLFATETFESYNFVIRLRSVHSNRRAPSHDIGRAFCRLHAVRFLVSGGWVTRAVDPVTHDVCPSTPRQAGSAILELKDDQLFMELMGMSHLSSGSLYGKFTFVTPTVGVSWSTTLASKCTASPNYADLNLAACASIVLKNNDVICPDTFVLIDLGECHCPAKVLEIWATLNTSQFLGLTVELGSFHPNQNTYNMPGVCFEKQTMFVCLESLICALSLFHNCAEHKCPITRTKIVRQERQETLLRGQEVQHQGDMSDLVLNAASLRSAAAIQVLRARPKILGTTETVAREAVIRWDEEQERAKAEKEGKDKEKEDRKVERERKKAGAEKRKAEKQAEKQGQGSNVGKGVNPGKQRRKGK